MTMSVFARPVPFNCCVTIRSLLPEASTALRLRMNSCIVAIGTRLVNGVAVWNYWKLLVGRPQEACLYLFLAMRKEKQTCFVICGIYFHVWQYVLVAVAMKLAINLFIRVVIWCPPEGINMYNISTSIWKSRPQKSRQIQTSSRARENVLGGCSYLDEHPQ